MCPYKWNSLILPKKGLGMSSKSNRKFDTNRIILFPPLPLKWHFRSFSRNRKRAPFFVSPTVSIIFNVVRPFLILYQRIRLLLLFFFQPDTFNVYSIILGKSSQYTYIYNVVAHFRPFLFYSIDSEWEIVDRKKEEKDIRYLFVTTKRHESRRFTFYVKKKRQNKATVKYRHMNSQEIY